MTEKLPGIIRCLDKDKNLFDLMTKIKPNDCAHTIGEQISTEELVKAEFMAFIEDHNDDPGYFF